MNEEKLLEKMGRFFMNISYRDDEEARRKKLIEFALENDFPFFYSPDYGIVLVGIESKTILLIGVVFKVEDKNFWKIMEEIVFDY